MVNIELVYVPEHAPAIHLHLSVPHHATVREVIQQSGISKTCPEIDHFSVGIFSTCVDWDTMVNAGDRVEIYRPLRIDPMEKRRQRARLLNNQK